MKKTTLLALLMLSCAGLKAQTTPTLVADVNTGFGSSLPRALAVLDTELYFTASLDASNRYALFRYKASLGATQVTPTNWYTTAESIYPLGVLNSKLYFYAEYSTFPSQYGVYYVAEGGTPHIIDSSVAGLQSNNRVVYGGKLYAIGSTAAGFGMCYIDATNHVTLAADLTSLGLGNITELTVFNNKIYFVSDAFSTTSHELYVFDPVTNTCTLASTITGVIDKEPTSLVAAGNNKLYFTMKTVSDGRELYSYTTTGTVTQETALNGSLDGVSGDTYRDLIQFGNALYFAGCDGVHGYELMKYDLTSGTSTLVKDINPSSNSSTPDNFYIYNGKLYFAAKTETNGRELWATDGTAANTTMVADLNTGAGDANPYSLCSYGGKLYLSANNGSSGEELYRLASTNGITSVSYASDITIYPNPSHGSVNIGITTSTDAEIHVVLTDMAGKTVYTSEKQQYKKGSIKISVPLDKVAPGVYQCSVVSDDNSVIATDKLILQ